MKALVMLLAATTLACGASTFHYAHRLREARAAAVALPDPGSRLAPTTDMSPPAAAPAASAAPMPAPDTLPMEADEPPDPGQVAVAHYQLDQLRDPTTRAARGAAITVRLLEDWRPSAREIGLTPAERDRVVADLVQQELEFQQRLAECRIEPGCNAPAMSEAFFGSTEERTLAALGPVLIPRYQAWRETAEERSIAMYLSQQFPDSHAMNPATRNRLVQALADQRRLFLRNAAQRGETVDSDGGSLMIRAAASPGTANEYARRRETATTYVQHTIDAAAAVLDPTQLAILRDLLEYRLESYTGHQRELEAANAGGGNPL